MTDTNSNSSHEAEDRRKFLENCGRFAMVTPPALMMLLSTSLTSEAIAFSTGGSPHRNNGNTGGNLQGNNGFGNGGGDGTPNNFEDTNR